MGTDIVHVFLVAKSRVAKTWGPPGGH